MHKGICMLCIVCTLIEHRVACVLSSNQIWCYIEPLIEHRVSCVLSSNQIWCYIEPLVGGVSGCSVPAHLH